MHLSTDRLLLRDYRSEDWEVMEKIGMKRVGFMKGDKVVKGHVRDSYRYEILKEEFR